MLFLLPRLTKSEKRYCKVTKSQNGWRDVAFLEDYLIASALRANPRLRNIKGTKYLQRLHVAGLINSTGRPKKDAVLLRGALDLR